MDEGCIFCIIGQDFSKATTQVVARMIDCYVMKPLNPKNEGHLLFIPYQHIELATDEPQVTARMFEVAAGYLSRVPVGQGNLIVNSGRAAGQTVPHLHIHMVPRGKGDKLAPGWPWHDRAEIDEAVDEYRERKIMKYVGDSDD